MRRPTRGLTPAAALLLAGLATPLAASAEMTAPERAEFGAEVRAYLLENPEILSEMFALLEAGQQAATAAADRDRIAASTEALFEDGFSFVGGNPDGDVTVVEFTDYQCGYCRRAHPEVAELIAGDGNIRRIVKEFPILGPGSVLAARAAIATLITAGPAKYAAVNDGLMTLDGPVTDAGLDATLKAAGLDPASVRAAMDDTEVTRRIEANLALAGALEISGTPTFVFADRMLRGYRPLVGMRDLIAEIRAVN